MSSTSAQVPSDPLDIIEWVICRAVVCGCVSVHVCTCVCVHVYMCVCRCVREGESKEISMDYSEILKIAAQVDGYGAITQTGPHE